MIFDLTQLKEKAPDAPAPRANVTLSGRSESIDNTYLKCRKLEYVHRVICGHRTRRKLAFDLYKTQVLDEFVKTLESSLVSKEDTQMNLALMKSLWPMPRSSTLDTYVNQIVGIRETTTPMEEMVNAISEHIANLTAGAAEKQKEEELAQEFARKRMDTSIMSSFKVIVKKQKSRKKRDKSCRVGAKMQYLFYRLMDDILKWNEVFLRYTRDRTRT